MEKINENVKNNEVEECNEHLVLLSNVADGKPILKELIDDEMIYNPDGVKCGRVVDILVLDKKNRDGQAYEQIQLVIEGDDNRRYTKNWSVDFTRKYFNQLGVKSADVIHAMCVFKVSQARFKNIGMFMFVKEIEDAGIDGRSCYATWAYEDEATDFTERLKKLGL